MNKKIYILAFIVFIVAVAMYYLITNKKEVTTPIIDQTSEDVVAPKTQIDFGIPKKSAHYETNTPSHGQTLAGVPINIVIDFNFDLADNSTISITKGGKEYGIGSIVIDSNKLSMRREIDPFAPDGAYVVNYVACWPDRSCHDGNFKFAIDRSLREGFVDMKGQKEVMLTVKDFSFNPRDIIVSPGTLITWVNEDEAVHYVNTDSHPAHTYYLLQNSLGIKRGDSFSVSFDKAGIYPYHCSAHASVMRGNILVEE